MSQPSDLDLPDLPDDVDLVEDVPPAAAAARPLDGERPPLRELDKAPRHLRLAATIVVVGSLLPWMGHGGGWMTLAAAKLTALLGAWLMLQQIKHDWDPELAGPFKGLAGLLLGGKGKAEEDKPRRRKAEAAPVSPMSHAPSVLQILALVIGFGVGCVALPFLDPTEGNTAVIGAAEVGMLAWAAFTWVHVFAYERWGQFNPLFALMFLGMFFAGVSRILAGIGIGFDGLPGVFAVAGGAIVGAGGGLAAYTMVEALREAKREGDAKKQAAAEARRAARSGRGGSTGGARRR